MEEHFKNCRFVQRLIIVVASGLLVFSLSSPSAEDYNLMLRKINSLQNLDISKMKNRVDQSLFKELEAKDFYAQLKEYQDTSPPLAVTDKSFDWNQYEEIHTLKRVIANGTLVEISERVEKRDPLKIFLPDAAEVFSDLKISSWRLSQYKQE
ncbi:MAG: hypothetical protein MI802_06640, partial [Desulfobacterales bacterium]|nr:hypothetical protein [Desulfobacterales bacterium]